MIAQGCVNPLQVLNNNSRHICRQHPRACHHLCAEPGLLLLVAAEIIEYTSPEETAVCNLASIALPRFVRERSQQVSPSQTYTPDLLQKCSHCSHL
jgi:hypothetical protein